MNWINLESLSRRRSEKWKAAPRDSQTGSQRRRAIERDGMGLRGRMVYDNLASKRDTESISSLTFYTGLVYYTDPETHKSEECSWHISMQMPTCGNLKSTLVRNPIYCCHRHSFTLYLLNCILPKILQIKKFNATMARPLLWIKLYFHPVLTVITLLAMN